MFTFKSNVVKSCGKATDSHVKRWYFFFIHIRVCTTHLKNYTVKYYTPIDIEIFPVTRRQIQQRYKYIILRREVAK